MKKLIAILLAALMLLALAGCSKAPAAAEGDLLAQIQAKGEIVIAMEGT